MLEAFVHLFKPCSTVALSAFDDEENFLAVADAVIPLLSPVENRGQFLPTVAQDKQERIFARFPRKVLELLCKILPQRSHDWPLSSPGGRQCGPFELPIGT